jgi:hypothetical protein
MIYLTSTEIVIASSLEEVRQGYLDGEGYNDWGPKGEKSQVKRIDANKDGPIGVGARWGGNYFIGYAEYEVIVAEANLIAFLAKTHVGEIKQTIDFKTLEDGSTKATSVYDGDLNYFGRIVLPGLALLLQHKLKQDDEALKLYLESKKKAPNSAKPSLPRLRLNVPKST